MAPWSWSATESRESEGGRVGEVSGRAGSGDGGPLLRCWAAVGLPHMTVALIPIGASGCLWGDLKAVEQSLYCSLL